MTGGSLPAMTFKRLMDYAEQGIEHRAIPGIENPLPGPDARRRKQTSPRPSPTRKRPAAASCAPARSPPTSPAC